MISSRRHTLFSFLSLVVTTLIASGLTASAHTGYGATHGTMPGLLHPLSGLDHILAMVAIGLWAAQIGGRALWTVPGTFVSMMAVGGMLGMMGVPVPFVEQGILASVLLLGLLIAFAVRLPIAAMAPLVACFAICHGYAHGAEAPENASGLLYGAGFILSTALLHGSGILLALAIQKTAHAQFVRACGVAIVALGFFLIFS